LDKKNFKTFYSKACCLSSIKVDESKRPLSAQNYMREYKDIEDNLRTRLLNHPCFGDVTEVDELISNLHTELENDCRTYKRVDESLHESLISCKVNEAVAVTQDPPSGPETSILETCPVVGSNPIIPGTECTNSDLSSSQKDSALLNVHEIVAVTVYKETENKSSITINAGAPNRAHHSAIEVSDGSSHHDSLVSPGMSYLSDSHVHDKKIYKNEENMSDASNDNQEPDAVLMDADYHRDPLSTNEILNKYEEAVSEESNLDNLISSVLNPHHLVTFRRSSVQREKCV
ncbi:unnamed protein product, partial [Schistosoma mattheei]